VAAILGMIAQQTGSEELGKAARALGAAGGAAGAIGAGAGAGLGGGRSDKGNRGRHHHDR
jgi:hypothetical protein